MLGIKLFSKNCHTLNNPKAGLITSETASDCYESGQWGRTARSPHLILGGLLETQAILRPSLESPGGARFLSPLRAPDHLTGQIYPISLSACASQSKQDYK